MTGINFGWGILQDLMVRQREGDGLLSRGRVAFWITKRERTIVATVIQWLGTNCGWGFLDECVRACGYRIVPADSPPPRRPPPAPRTKSLPRHARRFTHLTTSLAARRRPEGTDGL